MHNGSTMKISNGRVQQQHQQYNNNINNTKKEHIVQPVVYRIYLSIHHQSFLAEYLYYQRSNNNRKQHKSQQYKVDSNEQDISTNANLTPESLRSVRPTVPNLPSSLPAYPHRPQPPFPSGVTTTQPGELETTHNKCDNKLSV